jgi:branched-subunit amino acid ABC-type transport system permease component
VDLLSAGFGLVYQYADNIALLSLSALGLVVIFGMMGVINMAHGELMMIGAYCTSTSYYSGLPIPAAVVVGGIGAGIAGIVLERVVIRRFYGQLLSSLVATWGLSLVIAQGFLLVVGPSVRSLPTPLGSFVLGGFSYSYYRLAMLGASAVLILGVWALFKFTRFGIDARATMEDAEMARALGVRTNQIYMLTFGLGAMLAGLAGGLFALTAPIEPTFGRAYTPVAFITVVVGGGSDIIGGLILSALSLAAVKTGFTSQFNILIGHVAMLVAAFVIIRLMPNGISDLIERLRVRAIRREDN